MFGGQQRLEGRSLWPPFQAAVPPDRASAPINKCNLEAVLEQTLAQARRTDEQIAVLLLSAGREDMADTIVGCLAPIIRRSDTLCIAGDRELLVLHRAARSREGVALLASRLLQAASDVAVGRVSIGVAMLKPEHDEKAIVQDARAALGAARRAGGGRHAFAGWTAARVDRMTPTKGFHELQNALRRGEFFLEFQPQVAVPGERVLCFEALLRWRHPTRGVVPPADFIPAAERSGAIREIGAWAIEQALLRCREWNSGTLPGVPVAVNLSAVQLGDSDFSDKVREILGRVGLSAQLLELELTETALLEVTPEVSRILDNLTMQGIRLALDDFGTGYSSLRYLRDLPIDKVKIAGDFVQHLATRSADRAIVEGIVQVAHRLGMTVVAEGVETTEQVRQLVSLSCDAAQGYLLGAPEECPEGTESLRAPDPQSELFEWRLAGTRRWWTRYSPEDVSLSPSPLLSTDRAAGALSARSDGGG